MKKKGLILLALMVSAIVLFTFVLAPTLNAAANTQNTTYTYGGKTYNITTTTKGNVRTVKVTCDGVVSTVSYNLSTKEANVQERNANGENTAMATVNLAGLESKVSTASAVTPYAGSVIASGSESWFGHKYRVMDAGSTYDWYIWSQGLGHIKDRYENSTNTNDLNGYKDATDNADSNEMIAIGMIGASAALAVVAIITAAPTVGIGTIIAALAAIGAAAGAAGYIYAAYVQAKDADYHYARVK